MIRNDLHYRKYEKHWAFLLHPPPPLIYLIFINFFTSTPLQKRKWENFPIHEMINLSLTRIDAIEALWPKVLEVRRRDGMIMGQKGVSQCLLKKNFSLQKKKWKFNERGEGRKTNGKINQKINSHGLLIDYIDVIYVLYMCVKYVSVCVCVCLCQKMINNFDLISKRVVSCLSSSLFLSWTPYRIYFIFFILKKFSLSLSLYFYLFLFL